MLMIYAKHHGSSRFYPMDMSEGVPVKNKLYASVFDNSDRDRLETACRELKEENKDWDFEVRTA